MRARGGSSTPRLIHFIAGVSGILDRPLSRTMTLGVRVVPRNNTDMLLCSAAWCSVG